jgi:hypothetical protein
MKKRSHNGREIARKKLDWRTHVNIVLKRIVGRAGRF